MKFKNKENGYVEEASAPWLWTLLFGVLYFAVKGIWSHVVIGFVLGCITFGISWLVYPFFANGIVRKRYLQNGWVELDEYNNSVSGT